MGTSEPGLCGPTRVAPTRWQSRLKMFDKAAVDALLGELRCQWEGTPLYEQLIRDAHLAIALFDAGRPIDSKVARPVIELIEQYRPRN